MPAYPLSMPGTALRLNFRITWHSVFVISVRANQTANKKASRWEAFWNT